MSASKPTAHCLLQGLGKTVQTLALIATVPASKAFMSARHGGQHLDTEPGATSSADGVADAKRAKTQTLTAFLSSSTAADEPLTTAPPSLAGSLPACKATLIVCPMSLLSQWQEEADTHVDGLKVVVYHGPSRSMSLDAFCSAYDVILTTYGELLAALPLTSLSHNAGPTCRHTQLRVPPAPGWGVSPHVCSLLLACGPGRGSHDSQP